MIARSYTTPPLSQVLYDTPNMTPVLHLHHYHRCYMTPQHDPSAIPTTITFSAQRGVDPWAKLNVACYSTPPPPPPPPPASCLYRVTMTPCGGAGTHPVLPATVLHARKGSAMSSRPETVCCRHHIGCRVPLCSYTPPARDLVQQCCQGDPRWPTG